MKILATYNIKGGVGKTTSAVNLAFLAARDGHRTLVWDLDPQGAASFYFRVKPKIKGGVDSVLKGRTQLDDAVKATDFDGLDLLPSDFSFRNLDLAVNDSKQPMRQLLKLLRPLSHEYDMLFIDCAPSISIVSENIFFAADALLVPIIPTPLSVRTYEQILAYFDKSASKHLKILPFFSMVDRSRPLHKDLVDNLSKQYREILSTAIPQTKSIEMMGIHRAPVGHFAPESASAQTYEKLWREMQAKI